MDTSTSTACLNGLAPQLRAAEVEADKAAGKGQLSPFCFSQARAPWAAAGTVS
jgi:hypothetical protein